MTFQPLVEADAVGKIVRIKTVEDNLRLQLKAVFFQSSGILLRTVTRNSKIGDLVMRQIRQMGHPAFFLIYAAAERKGITDGDAPNRAAQRAAAKAGIGKIQMSLGSKAEFVADEHGVGSGPDHTAQISIGAPIFRRLACLHPLL